MALLSIFESDKGFTFIEVLIAVGILAIIISLGLFFSFDFYKSFSAHSEKNIVVSILQKARSQSLNNVNQTRHGVHFEANPNLKYIIFEGSSYDSSIARNIVIDSSYGISLKSPAMPFDIIFDQLSGDCISAICSNPEPTITLSYGSQEYNININNEGRIDW